MRLGMDFKKWAMENSQLFDPATAKLIQEGPKAFRAQIRTFYSNVQITNLGAKTKLVNDQQVKLVGVTDLDKGQLTGTDNLLLMFIGLGYDYHATETTLYNRKWSNSLFNYSDGSVRVPAQIRNTVLHLEIGGAVKVSAPTDQLFVENKEKLTITGDYRNKLSIADNPILIKPNTQIMPFFEGNDLGTIPSGVHFIRTELTGLVIEKV